MKYTAIGFDYGGVIEGRPSQFFNEMVCRTLDISLTEYELTYFRHNREHNNGKLISQNELWQRFVVDVGKPELLSTLLVAIEDYKSELTVNTDVLELITRLKNNGYKLGLLSNNSVSVGKRLRVDGIDKYFDSFVVSAEIGMMKPDKNIFDYFCSELAVEPNQLIYIDDSEKSLSTAPQCGYTPILFSTYTNLIQQLQALGVDTH
ncbi:HAD-IA family hydrolase [Candidatus Saccharibacteria bacterium]|nr:HAD-IA family hydrolase [Candidatus Saccharibacteria bacterium]